MAFKADEQKVKGIELTINQIPSGENSYEAIVTSKITKGDSFVSGIGASNPQSAQCGDDTQRLLDVASRNAIDRAKEYARIKLEGSNNNQDIGTQALSETNPILEETRNIHHRTEAGTASERQKNGLRSVIKRHGSTLETVVQEKFGISCDDLSSAQAHKLYVKFVK